MNVIMSRTRVWYCHICDKTINIKSKLKHINSITHKHRQKYGTIVKEYEFIIPDIDEVIYILNDTIEGCKKNFHSLECRCVYNFKFTNMENNEEVFCNNYTWINEIQISILWFK